MEDNDEVVSNKTYKIIDEDPIKIQLRKQDRSEKATGQYLESGSVDLNPEVASGETGEDYLAMPKSHRGRRGKRQADVKSQTQTATPKRNSGAAELHLRPKYRPIRPKPYISNVAVKNKLLEIPWNVNSNPLIVTTSLPGKDKVRDVTAQNSSKSKTDNYVKLVGDNVGVVTKKGNSDNKSATGNSNNVAAGKDSRNVKSPSKYPVGGIELFFESMAQAVLNLPTHVQAEIKMEICKLVTMAEIKYCGSQSRHKTD